jgi:DNA-binding NtrC family response regulator
MSKPKVLLLNAGAPVEALLGDVLGDFQAATVRDLPQMLSLLDSGEVDCVLVTGFAPDLSGAIQALEQVQYHSPNVPVIFWDPAMRSTDAVHLTRAGARHCVGYGDSPDALRDHVLAAISDKFCRELRINKEEASSETWRTFLVGESKAMERVAETIRLIGARRCTVLISGESGTGKEVVARALHMASPRANGPLVSVNCSALPENLLEAELFGHVKGAFTGAVNLRIGRFEQADKGTILLDEIGDMPLELQAKLLRVLQEREIQRLGSSETIRIDVRVIASTNIDLMQRIRQGKFREDLYYRLNVVPLRLPALKERTTDIPQLAEYFLKKVCKAEGIPVRRVCPETLQRLQASDWPGNVRQLQNAVEMAVAFSGEREELYPADFGLGGGVLPKGNSGKVIPFRLVPEGMPETLDFNAAVTRFERSMLEQALGQTCGNKTAAAELLGIKRTTLIMKLRSFEPAIEAVGT